jgi:tRNA 2-thiouridine synthesizing protein A
LDTELEATVVAAGFVSFEITWRADVFSGAPQSSSAAEFGTQGINLRARKPVDEQEWEAAWAALTCEIPTSSPMPDGTAVSTFGVDAFYDAGDKGCGAGPLDDIADLMRRLPAGQTLEIRATDPSVAVDLAAWCRLTGHTLVTQEGDHYLIRHK